MYLDREGEVFWFFGRGGFLLIGGNKKVRSRLIKTRLIEKWLLENGKSGLDFPVDLQARCIKDCISRAACNYVEKNCNLRRYNELLSKSMLVALCENKGEKTIETSVSIWRGFSLLFNRGFSRLLVLFEKFRCFWRRKHFKEGMQMTRQFYFEVSFEHDIETGEAKKLE